MARKKSNKFTGVFHIFFSSLKSYFLYLDQSSKQLAFPIFGQIIGLFLICTATYYFRINYENIQSINSFFATGNNALYVFLVLIIPFFLIFIKAFFDYIIAFSSLNILFFTTSGKTKVKNIDFASNNNVIKRRLPEYIILMLILSIIMVPLFIISPIFCLVYQVFALEPDSSPTKAISRSIELVKGNIIPTLILLVLCYGVTYWFLPDLLNWALDKISLEGFFLGKFEAFYALLPIDYYNEFLSMANQSINVTELAMNTYTIMISFIVIGFTLPFRCCCFTELYKLYDSDKIKENSKQTDEIISRATGKKRKTN